MARLVPIGLAVVAIVALTVFDGMKSGRWGDGLHAAYCADLLREVPTTVGDWVGEDTPVDATTRNGAGARGYVSRSYVHQRTGQRVGVWLISGNGRDVIRHTPDVCYPSDGHRAEEKPRTVTFTAGEAGEATFNVARFSKQIGPTQAAQSRVFWAWFNPAEGSGDGVAWDAPEGRRYKYGGAKALYKLYFTCVGPEALEPPEESVCLEFAEVFLPVAEDVLSKANGPTPDDYVPSDDVAEAA